jgi:hypothetical protein
MTHTFANLLARQARNGSPPDSGGATPQFSAGVVTGDASATMGPRASSRIGKRQRAAALQSASRGVLLAFPYAFDAALK